MRRLATCLCALGLLSILSAPGASADFGLSSFEGQVRAVNGEAFTPAAGHPDLVRVESIFNVTQDPFFGEVPDGQPKDIAVDVPPGLVGNPTIVPTCSENQLEGVQGDCPASSQVGFVEIRLAPWNGGTFRVPVFNMPPTAGLPALFGFRVFTTPVHLEAHLRSDGDYGITISTRNIPEVLAVAAVEVVFWGVPADSSHDAERGNDGDTDCVEILKDCSTKSESPREWFLRTPSDCTGPARFVTRASNWEHPEKPVGSEFFTPAAFESCEVVPFDPSVSLAPTSQRADSPTGLDLELHLPQDQGPDATASSDLRGAVIELPRGMVVNPAAATGLASCSEEELARETADSPPGVGCPQAAKIGTVEVVTPLLKERLEGSVFVARQGQNRFGSLLALYVVARSRERGVVVTLAGKLTPGPDGQLTAAFDDNPQLPFSSFAVHLKGGSRAPLINPPNCGTYTARTELTPWARPNGPVAVDNDLRVTEGPGGAPCPPDPLPLAAGLDGGSESPRAGAFTSLRLRLTRGDGSQRLTGITVSPPAGLLASLRGVPYCENAVLAAISGAEGTGAAQLGSPTCPEASRVGTVSAGAGAGPVPFFLSTGRVYLAGPYKGAPLSLAIVTPAVAGPFDLGNVVVRTAVDLDPVTGRVTAISDPIPTILHGIPLDLREVRVDLDRPRFTRSPTSCDPVQIDASLTGEKGGRANVSSRYQLAGCGDLEFGPKLSLRLEGKVRRTAHPRLIATVNAKPEEAGIARAQVKLPPSVFLDQAHIRQVCTRPQFAAHACPAGSVYGHAKAFTPLLDYQFEGKVYLRSNPAHTLPDLVAELRGPDTQPIVIELAGKTDSVKRALRNTFEAVPDAPISRFRLELLGGKRGLVVMSGGFCENPRAVVKLEGHNGKTAVTRPAVEAKGCKADR